MEQEQFKINGSLGVGRDPWKKGWVSKKYGGRSAVKLLLMKF